MYACFCLPPNTLACWCGATIVAAQRYTLQHRIVLETSKDTREKEMKSISNDEEKKINWRRSGHMWRLLSLGNSPEENLIVFGSQPAVELCWPAVEHRFTWLYKRSGWNWHKLIIINTSYIIYQCWFYIYKKYIVAIKS